MPPRIDFHGDDWLPEDHEDESGSYSEDYDIGFDNPFDKEFDS